MSAGEDEFEYLRVQRFLTREAAILDDRRWDEWLALFAESGRYRIRISLFRDLGSGPGSTDIVNEGVADLRSRIAQISNPKLTRAENPPSLARRFVSNFDVVESTKEDLLVASNILLYRARNEEPVGGFYVGKRRDILVRDGVTFRIQERDVTLDQATLLEGALSLLL